MVDKAIDIQELIRLVQAGADVSIEDRPIIIAKHDPSMRVPTKIEGFDALLEKLDAVIEAGKANEARVAAIASAAEARAQADKANSQRQLEVLTTLQALIKSGSVTKSQSIDMQPLQTVLSEILENTQPMERLGYEMTFDRDRQGWIDGKVTVTPISPSKH